MDYIVDVEGKRLISSFTSTRTTSAQSVIFGDEPTVTVRLVEPNTGSSAFPWRYVDLTGHSIRVAIGNPGGDPISGTFSLTFDGDTTTDLVAGSTAAQVDAALNLLTSITSAGGVTVTSAATGQYQIAFNSAGARNIITANTDALYPASSAYIYEATAGDVSTKEVQVANIEVDNAAYVELTTDIAAPAATVTTVREGVTGTTSELQRVEISGDPYLGTFAISINGNTSSAISIDATIDELTTAIEGISGIGAGNVVITGTITDFTIQFAASLGNVAEATVDVANLTGAVGKTGTLDLNTNQFLELLNGAASVNATLEIVKFKTTGSKSDTVLQTGITCREDVIANTPVSTTPFPAYAAASHTHNEADISDLGATVTLNADTNLAGNGWFLDDDTMAANDSQKVASQQSIKAYVDTQVAGVSGIADVVDDTTPQLGGQLDVNGNAIGDGTLELVKFTETPSAVNEITITNAATAGAPQISATGDDANIDLDLQPKGTGNVTLGNFTLDGDQTVGAGQDNYVLTYDDGAGTISLEAAAGGTPEGTAILSTGEVGGTKFLREDGDGTCSWQAVPAGGLTDIVNDTTPQLGGMLDVNGNAIGDGTLELLTFTETGSAVNHINITNAATGNEPEIAAAGDDANVDLTISAKGTGEIIRNGESTIQRNGNFGTAGDAQAMTYVLRGTTTDATFTEIFLDGSSARMVLPDDTTWAFDALIVARLGTTQASAAYNVFGCIDNESGTVALVGSVQKGTPIEDNPNASDWDVQFTADDTNDSLKLEVKGGTGLGGTIRWVATVRISQVTHATSSSY